MVRRALILSRKFGHRSAKESAASDDNILNIIPFLFQCYFEPEKRSASA